MWVRSNCVQWMGQQAGLKFLVKSQFEAGLVKCLPRVRVSVASVSSITESDIVGWACLSSTRKQGQGPHPHSEFQTSLAHMRAYLKKMISFRDLAGIHSGVEPGGWTGV